MFWKSLATLALGLLGISLITNNAIASLAPLAIAATTIRDTDTVYRTGLAPDSTVQVELPGTPPSPKPSSVMPVVSSKQAWATDFLPTSK
jgi:hypothetical protein